MGEPSRIEARLSRGLVRRVKIHASETEQSRSSVIEKALEAYLSGRDEIDRAKRAVAFFRSVILSGEHWSDTCEETFRSVFPES